MPTETDFRTVAEVMTRLRLKKADQVYALIASGALGAVNVATGTGRKVWRISEADLEVFLRNRRNVPAGTARPRDRRRRAQRVTKYF